MVIHESKYTIKLDSNNQGFQVLGRKPVRVYLNGPKICVNLDYNSFGLYEFYSILKSIGQNVMGGWKGNEDKWHKMGMKGQAKLTDWATLQTRKALAKRVKGAWLEILKNADPTHLAVHKAVFAASAKCSEAIKQENIYRRKNRFLVSDILKYRAAALATFHMGFALEYYNQHENWMQYYAPHNEVYPTLKKILPNLPGGIPQWMVPNFQMVHFEKPVTDRLELLTILFSPLRNPNLRVLMHAQRPEIKRAIVRVAEHLRQKPNTRKVNSIEQAIRFITDYPEKHNGNIYGLAEKSCRWHRNLQFSTSLNGYFENTQTARPPIPLPDNKNIRFLGSAGEIYEEGAAQSHCISRYINGAVRGEYYLFHTDYKGVSASTQVDRMGRVLQSYGFRNSTNAATAYSRRVLGDWGKLLKDSKVVYEIDPIPF